jgi:hypothetical protein
MAEGFPDVGKARPDLPEGFPDVEKARPGVAGRHPDASPGTPIDSSGVPELHSGLRRFVPKKLGPPEKIGQAFAGFQRFLYAAPAA